MLILVAELADAQGEVDDMIADGSHMAWGLRSIGYSGCFIQTTMERAKARGLQYAPISNHVPAPRSLDLLANLNRSALYPVRLEKKPVRYCTKETMEHSWKYVW